MPLRLGVNVISECWDNFCLSCLTNHNIKLTAFQYLHLWHISFINDADVANYADDTTPYVIGKKICAIVASLERPANLMFNWFTNNQMKGYEDKFHILLRKIAGALINSSKRDKLLVVKIDNDLSFDEYVWGICKKQLQN